jgi:hypothetical protein
MHERRIGDIKASMPRVALLGSTVHIGNLEVPLDAAAEYMRGIPEEKREAAFVHAVQVGMSEIIARRRRFQMGAHNPAAAAAMAPRPQPIVPRPEVIAPRAEVIAPRAEVIAPRAEVIAPRAEVIAPRAEVIAPRAEVIAPRVEVIAPRVEVVAPRAEAVAPPAEVVKPVEEKEAQPKVTPPPDPRMETVAPPPPESESWLRRLDEDLEVLDSVHALDASRSGR